MSLIQPQWLCNVLNKLILPTQLVSRTKNKLMKVYIPLDLKEMNFQVLLSTLLSPVIQ